MDITLLELIGLVDLVVYWNFLVKDTPYQIRPDLIPEHKLFEATFVEIDKDVFHKNRNIITGVIYRPPDTDLKLFNDNFYDLLDTLGRERKYCYLMGDFNINLLNIDKHAETTSFVDMLHAQSFVSLINRPTRVTKNSTTLIDNIFTNWYCNIENTFQCLIYRDVSDHFPIVHIDFEMQLCDTDTAVTRRNLSYKNKDFMNQFRLLTRSLFIVRVTHKLHLICFTVHCWITSIKTSPNKR